MPRTAHTPAADHLLPHLPAGWVPAATCHAHALRRQAITDAMDSLARHIGAALGRAVHELSLWRRPGRPQAAAGSAIAHACALDQAHWKL